MTATAVAGVTYAYGSYMQLLALLPDTPTRAARASLLDEMAGLADQLAGVVYGHAAEDDPAGDSLAWRDAATLVRHLAAAERGATVTVIPPVDDDDEDGDDFTDLDLWSRLAVAVTRYEHAAAVHEIGRLLLARRTRPHAYEAFMAAATACAIGYPDSYPTAGTYQPRC
jgi:hypothetical protein